MLASNQGAQAPKAPAPVRLTETKEVLHDEKQTMEICGKSGPAAVSECQHCGRRLCGRRLGGGTERLPRRWRWLADGTETVLTPGISNGKAIFDVDMKGQGARLLHLVPTTAA